MEYKTFKEDGLVQEEIKKSRFLCHVKRVYTEEEARDFIAAVKKEHYKATHNCSAFVIGQQFEIKRTSDDGEPSGTAGVPMLGVLENHELTNVCCVVTRYFGGIKLGAGGLIRAYAGSVAQAVKEIGLVEIKEQVGLGITLTYPQYQEFVNFLSAHQLAEFQTDFTDAVFSLIYVDKEQKEDVIADLKHSLIEPQGDFVKLSSVDNEAKTVVISDEELGEIKHSPKKRTSDIAQLEDEEYDTDYDDGEDDYDDDGDYRRKRSSDKKSRKKHKAPNTGLTILALLAGAAILVAAIFFIGKAAGIIGGDSSADTSKTGQNTDASTDEEGMVVVPNLVGKTEEEAAALLEKEKLGKQMMGEESSTQEKGRISSQNIAAGTKVEQYTTLKYYISKGQQTVTMPDLSGETGVDAKQTLEDLGLKVNIQKAYSEDDGSGYPLVNPGYVDSYTPEAGSSVSAGDEVTLVVSRGLDYGNSVSVPSVVGMTENDAITTLGKWIDVQVTEQQSTDVAAGEVISQNPEADTTADPDQPITIVVSSGNEAPAAQTDNTASAADTQTDNTAATQSAADTSAQQSAAVANGEVWKCTQTLNTPTGYQGGAIRLELIQEVNGEMTSTQVVDGEKLTFPYTLDITGAPGVGAGTLYVSEQINGTYQQLGQYPITFQKAE